MKTKDDKKRIKIRRKIGKKLRWGVAGCGNYLETMFLPALLQTKRSRLISVYSSSEDRAQFISHKFSAQSYFTDYGKFLNSDIDTVYISSATSRHFVQAVKAAEAGKNILLEVPAALNSREAAEINNVCKRNNVNLAVNYLYRFHPFAQKAKELIDKQMIGKLVSISVAFNINRAPGDNFRFKKELSGGGALRDLGTHMIDLLRFFGGEIEEISGHMDNIIYQSEVEDFAQGVVKFEKSGYGNFIVSYNTRKSFNRIDILGYKGSLSIENIIGRKSASGKIVIDLEGEAKKAFRKRANKLLRLVKSVQRSFLKDLDSEVTGEDALINLELIEKFEEYAAKK